MRSVSGSATFLVLLASAALAAQQPTPQPTTDAEAPSRDTSYIDSQGTAHITRVVPIPATISTQAQLFVGRAEPDQVPPEPLALRRSRTNALSMRLRMAWTRLCPNQLIDDTIAGVPVHIVTPEGIPPRKPRQGSPQSPRRRLQLRLRLLRRVHPHRQLRQN